MTQMLNSIMRFVFLLIVFHCFQMAMAKDSTVAFRRFSFQVGNVFADMYGNDHEHIRMSSLSVIYAMSYQFRNRLFVGIQRYQYGNGTDDLDKILSGKQEDVAPGNTLSSHFTAFRLNFGRKITFNNFFLSPIIAFNYRFKGGEEYYVGQIAASNWNEFESALNPYNSFGIGGGFSAGYVIKNRMTVSVESQFAHNFEKIRAQQGSHINPNDYGFKPSRNYITLHVMLGVLL